MDYSDYNGVIKKYNIDDSDVRKIEYKDFNIRCWDSIKKERDFFYAS
jgi:hypothetical protein